MHLLNSYYCWKYYAGGGQPVNLVVFNHFLVVLTEVKGTNHDACWWLPNYKEFLVGMNRGM